MARNAALIGLLVLLAAGSATAAAMTVRDEMKALVEPASNTIFALGGDVDPANGPDAAKVEMARWQQGLIAAQALKLAAIDLNGSQKRPDPAWVASAGDFAKLTADLEAAATTRNGAAFSTAANALGDTCSACHAKFKPQAGE